jgi:hypothetical protein
MLDRLAASTHRIRIFVQARLHGIDNVLALPPLDAPLRSLRALSQEPTSPNALLKFRNGPICHVGPNYRSFVVPATRR